MISPYPELEARHKPGAGIKKSEELRPCCRRFLATMQERLARRIDPALFGFAVSGDGVKARGQKLSFRPFSCSRARRAARALDRRLRTVPMGTVSRAAASS